MTGAERLGLAEGRAPATFSDYMTGQSVMIDGGIVIV